MSEEKCQSSSKSICGAHLWDLVTHVYGKILHWYRVFGDKVYMRNKTLLFYCWYEQRIMSVCKCLQNSVIIRCYEKVPKFVSKLITVFLYTAITSILGLKICSKLSIV